MTHKDNPPSISAFTLKGSMLTVMVLQLHETNLAVLSEQLRDKVAQAPGMFANTPLILDLSDLSDGQAMLDWQGLFNLCQTQGLSPIALRGGSAYWQSQAQTTALPWLNAPEHAQKNTTPSHIPAKIVQHPVRSGQQIVAEGDLIILSMVSPGAEILAGGNIHVYGALRGRALAGINGDEQARIFCLKLEAELLSISGQYQIQDELDETWLKKSTQIYLDQDGLKIQAFSV